MDGKTAEVLVGIVTFNPDNKRLSVNLNAAALQAENIVIVDNGSHNIRETEELISHFDNNIVLIKWKENRGIAAALKKITDYADENGFKWVLTLDQDSVICPGLIEKYLYYADKSECANVGMFTCLIKDRNFSDKKHEKQQNETENVDCCITSGAFTSVDKYKQTDGYDESFFIDCVDFDMCYQLRDAGFDICRIKFEGLLHEVGRGENRRFLGKSIVVYHHNAKRIYTLSRNWCYVHKKHKKIFPLHRLLKKYIALFIRIVCYEDNKGEKLKAFFGGIRDSFK